MVYPNVFLFSVFLLFLSFLGVTSYSCNSTSHLDYVIPSSQIVKNEFIVIFNRYMAHEVHKTVLNSLIGDIGWEIVERKNPSWFLPSDFSLIKITNFNTSFVDHCLNTLRQSRDIRHVIPQKKLRFGLKEQVVNKVGRTLTKFSFEDNLPSPSMRKLHSTTQITEMLNAQVLWEKGFTGKNVKVAVFDTGLRANHPHFRNVIEITNWTDEETSEDNIGHGTFVAGVISSQTQCLGFAPDSDLYIFRIFTTNRASYTSWFLDAFNYAIHSEINILNLSIGGPDFMDKPFVEKVWELSANNIIVVSAIGNDGPLYGTLNNPADQLDVIGVGGIDFKDRIASFSSRGMTTWELPNGYGRVKPDIVAYGQNVQGLQIHSGCRTLSGTSVASPVVAGITALLASSIDESKRQNIINPASMKQVLLETAERIPEAHIYEQGAGKVNLLGSYYQLLNYKPRASCFPRTLDLTNCPYMWPFCNQPLYYSAMPLIFNVTILNGMGVFGEIREPPIWKPSTNGQFLELSFSYSEVLWPWTGFLGIYLRVHEDGKNFEGNVEGIVTFTVYSPPQSGETQERITEIELPIRVYVIPTPPRSKRLLWDQFHNLRYPSGYFPRDSLDRMDEPFDWNGDHLHTNFRGFFQILRKSGYFVEILGSPFTCFNASLYSTLMIVDSEDHFFDTEIQKLIHDIEIDGLSVVVFADWYDSKITNKLRFFDDNTRRWWTPATGGANVPQINKLLDYFNIELGEGVFVGEFDMKQTGSFSSGVPISKFPAKGGLFFTTMMDKTIALLHERVEEKEIAFLGFYETRNDLSKLSNETGKIVVFGDSGCIDDSNNDKTCFWLLSDILKYTSEGKIPENLVPFMTPLEEAYVSPDFSPPKPFEGNEFYKYSKIFGNQITCAQRQFQRSQVSEYLNIVWQNDSTSTDSSEGKFRTQSYFKPSRMYKDTIFNNSITLYIIGMGIILAVIALLLKLKQSSHSHEFANL